MKRKLSIFAFVSVFIIGLLILLYPTISSYYNDIIGSYAITTYENSVSDIKPAEAEAIIDRAEEYNSELLNRPMQFINGEPKDESYKSQLKISEIDKIMGYIEIDKIKLKLPIYHGTGKSVLQKAVGHIEGSSLPIGGVGNHSVLSGHRGLPSAKLFTNLDKMEIGDRITIKFLGEEIDYAVYNIAVVEPEEVDLLAPIADKDLITLVTCTPYGVNSHRLLVQAERTEFIDEELTYVGTDKPINPKRWIIILIAIVLFTILIFFIIKEYKYIVRRNKRRKKVERMKKLNEVNGDIQ